ncbi:MAG: glycosyl transferase [Candidatus Saganbacteria bacterium]|nr:glycosyl transferase [Candidatus Saganbacteria bacterium]
MKYGYFDGLSKEYVITRPDTPLPWINYLGCEEYCALMSNTAGGYSFFRDPKERRLLRYRYNNIPYDRGGRYLYVRDNKTNEFWSATWQPVQKPTAKMSVSNDSVLFPVQEGKKDDYIYECRHGLGYTKITSNYKGIQTTTTYFVPLGESCEVWMMEIKNNSLQPRSLGVFSFVEFCLWDALNDMTDYQYNLNIGETKVTGNMIYHLSRYRVEKSYFGYFSCSEDIAGFDTQREDFLGRYGDLSAPRAVVENKSNNSIACGWAPVGSHNIQVNLKSGETKTIIFVLGYSEKAGDEKRVAAKFSNRENVEKELKKLAKHWEDNLDKLWVKTPDEDVNLMVNVWNQYQVRTTFNWSRSASYYESGIGRGMGFRDSNQDTMGFVYQIPERVKQRIIDLASTQFEDGDANHQYSPLTKKGSGRGYSDDHLWLVYSVSAYIKETGDAKFLLQKVPYETGKKDTIYKHLAKAINYSLKHKGPHGLPLAGFADWNDCLNMTGPKKQAESVMVGQMLAGACAEMSRMAVLIRKRTDSKKYKKLFEKVKKQINKVAWDGEWYIRAFDDNKKAVGTKKNKEGKIFLETQGWAVLTGVAEKDRMIKCLDSVKKHLATKYGIMILQPSFSKFYPELGSISIYPPGLKENGAIFCHPNPWIIISECIAGRGEQAFEYYKAIAPSEKNKMPDTHKLEPYVYCQMIAGKDHKDFGEAKNAWLTGSAAWNFMAISQWILGIMADYEGLTIDPCIPSVWDGFEVKRHFRGCDYLITVKNPDHVCKGIREVKMNGRKIKTNILKAPRGAKQVKVEVVMG